jgi:hypothetical protein
MSVAVNSACLDFGEALFLCEFHFINSIGDFLKLDVRTSRTFFLVEAEDGLIAFVLG